MIPIPFQSWRETLTCSVEVSGYEDISAAITRKSNLWRPFLVRNANILFISRSTLRTSRVLRAVYYAASCIKGPRSSLASIYTPQYFLI
uniref:Uncharacterized protein n=1 Tax=Candidatus Kentrum sp. TUN TaxID=2126343 RepID=A0A451ABL6_9GAMM|nr:MAG: hypothetical protein BECKTUN1418D_GA0071000_12125 [Candidatus Kentron sp. TUN]